MPTGAAQQSAEAAQTAAAAAERSSLAARRSADAAVENAATAAAVARHDQERGRRLELLDRLRWAAELALSPEESRARLGRAHLADLGRIAHQDDTIQRAIDTTLAAVLQPAAEVVAAAGEAVIVVRRDVNEPSRRAVPWEADEEEGEP